MSLSSLQLDAFVAVSRTLHFSKAAQLLHITQSALSQRIANLEADLGMTLLIRERSGVRITDAGLHLLRYCQTRDGLEQETLAKLKGAKNQGLGGVLRIGAYSSVMRSVILPGLSALVRENPAIHVECFVREMRELPELLKRGEADFIVLDHEIERMGIERRKLGAEELVLIEPKTRGQRLATYLDHDPEDPTTERFLARQGEPTKARTGPLTRSYLDEIYGLMDGVAMGWGRAVVPKHLAGCRKDIRIAKSQKRIETPVVLHFQEQPYYSELHQAVVKELVSRCPKLLASPAHPL